MIFQNQVFVRVLHTRPRFSSSPFLPSSFRLHLSFHRFAQQELQLIEVVYFSVTPVLKECYVSGFLGDHHHRGIGQLGYAGCSLVPHSKLRREVALAHWKRTTCRLDTAERGWGYCTPNIICQSNYLWSLLLYFTMTLLASGLTSASSTPSLSTIIAFTLLSIS